jgi:hypothetical protein
MFDTHVFDLFLLSVLNLDYNPNSYLPKNIEVTYLHISWNRQSW